MVEEASKGKLFSHLYLDRSTPATDSPTFRRRVGFHLDEITSDAKISHELGNYLTREMGVEIPGKGYAYWFENFFKREDIKYLLNAITLVWKFLCFAYRLPYEKIITEKQPAKDWRIFVQRVLDEENIGYTLDEYCGVHYRVDQEFEHNRVSLLGVLQSQRYAGVRAAFEDAHRHVDSQPQDTKAAVRSMFESVEILVKQMVKTNNLNKWIVENTLKTIALEKYSNDAVAQKTVDKVFDGMAQWVDGLHNYRHGQGLPEPVAPPLDFTVYVLSTGAAFLRWLIEIDTKMLMHD